MLRQSLLWLSEQQGVFNFVRTNSVARKFASRFVAGETVEQAVAAALELHRHGVAASLDLLGESVSREAEAAAAKDQYLSLLQLLAAGNLEVNVSVKLTQMGLDVDEAVCARNVRTIVEQAAEQRIDNGLLSGAGRERLRHRANERRAGRHQYSALMSVAVVPVA